MMLTGVVRGCGTREEGGVYLESQLSKAGMPLEEFLCDPPMPADLNQLGIGALGVKLFEVDGVTHMFDWVGSEHYPNVADFIEEVRRFGLSRRISGETDFSKITEKSKIYLVHSRAVIHNWYEYKHPDYCAHGSEDPIHAEHTGGNSRCIGTNYLDIQGGNEITDGLAVVRSMPSFTYSGFRTPDHVKPSYAPGVFMWMPVTNLAVIKSNSNPDKEAKAFDKASKSPLNVNLEDE